MLIDGAIKIFSLAFHSYVGLIKLTICSRCGAAVKIIAGIEDPLVIKKILDHLDTRSLAPASANQLPEPRAPPQASLFDY